MIIDQAYTGTQNVSRYLVWRGHTRITNTRKKWANGVLWLAAWLLAAPFIALRLPSAASAYTPAIEDTLHLNCVANIHGRSSKFYVQTHL